MTKTVLPYFSKSASGSRHPDIKIGGRVGPIGRANYAAEKFGVEGFPSRCSKRRRLGHTGPILETGGFERLFGLTSELREGRPEYDATVGATVRFHGNYDGKQRETGKSGPRPLLHIHRYPNRGCGSCLEVTLTNRGREHRSQILASDREWKDVSFD